MADHKVHLVVGKVAADNEGKNIAVVAEKIFKLNTDEQIDAVEAERRGMLMSTTGKRPASDLIVETPAKVKLQMERCLISCMEKHVVNNSKCSSFPRN